MRDEKIYIESKLQHIIGKYHIHRNDAIVIDCLEDLIKKYERFIIDTLRIEQNKMGVEYEAVISPQGFYDELDTISRAFINVTTSLRKAQPQVSTVFATSFEELRKIFDSIQRKGNKDNVLKLRNKFRDLKHELSDLLKTGEPEKLLDTYIFATEERALKVWTNGLKKLAEHDEATVLLSWLVKKGRGIPMDIDIISRDIGKGKTWVNVQLKTIRKNAPELISLGQRFDGKITYHVDSRFHQFHFG